MITNSQTIVFGTWAQIQYSLRDSQKLQNFWQLNVSATLFSIQIEKDNKINKLEENQSANGESIRKEEIKQNVSVSINNSRQIEGALKNFDFVYKKKSRTFSNYPQFNEITEEFLYDYTDYSPVLQIDSGIRWTPYIQIQDISKERQFTEQMKYFNKIKTMNSEYEAELIDCFIFQALQQTGYDYYYNYQCLPSQNNLFHGKVDFLIYNNKSMNKFPLIPDQNRPGHYLDSFNIPAAISAALWSLKTMRTIDPTIEFSRALITNGSIWQIIQISQDYKFEKSAQYIPNDKFQQIYRDTEMQSIVLGLIKFALNTPQEPEIALKQIYDFIDERRYLTELDAPTKQKLEKQSKFWFFLPKSVKQFFF